MDHDAAAARADQVMRALGAALVALVCGCGSCAKKADELGADSGFHPSGADGAAALMDAAPAAPRLTPEERRDARIRVGHEDCERAAKRINTLHQRAETDVKGIDIVSRCLQNGNMAWYRCVVDAPGAAEADRCGQRFLSPDEVPAR